MTLTPEDVVNKRFNATRVREGYAQEEVDDFLDEVVEELRRLNAESDDLRERLRQAEQRVAELSRAQAAGDGAPAVQAPAAAPVPAAAAPAVSPDDVQHAAGILAMAQRLHDEYVRGAESQRDRIVSDAQARAEQLVAEAQGAADQLVSGAHEERDRTLGRLQGERLDLESAIGQLRDFERTSRGRLTEFFQNQLAELERREPVVAQALPGAPGGAAGAQVGAQPEPA
ncbi:DivIVA domain-containing protein, partial [Kineococcus glutinatus]|uniref:DivIVA domain-containing protein n=1 Tax=Kineococcus glutinatus TaxID=1070872 RepID=UPI0031E8A1E0